MITLEDILGIFRQITIDFPFNKDRRLNTFAILDDRTDLNTENFENKWEDYENGHFWSRAWVNAGAIRGKEVREYDALVIESKTVRIAELLRRSAGFNGTYELGVSIVSPVKCDGCNRTWKQIDRDNREMMVNVYAELITYGKYIVTTTTGVTEGWIAAGRAALLSASIGQEGSTVLSVEFTGKKLLTYMVETNNINIFVSHFGVDNLRSVSVIMKFQGCLLPQIEFNYEAQSSKQLGIVVCKTC